MEEEGKLCFICEITVIYLWLFYHKRCQGGGGGGGGVLLQTICTTGYEIYSVTVGAGGSGHHEKYIRF